MGVEEKGRSLWRKVVPAGGPDRRGQAKGKKKASRLYELLRFSFHPGKDLFMPADAYRERAKV